MGVNDILNLESINDILDNVSKKLTKYLDVKTNILDNEYVQILGETSKVVGFLRQASTLIAQKRFEAFLKGFNSNDVPSEIQLTKLCDYIDNEEKAQFISDTLSKILLSKSTKSCMILGYVMYDVIENKQNISHDYLICVDALMNLFDKDIENIKFIYRFLDTTKKSKFYGLGRPFNEAREKENIDKGSLQLTLEKAVYHQVLNRTYEIDLNLNIDGNTPEFSDGDAENDEYYYKSNPGKLLYHFICLCEK